MDNRWFKDYKSRSTYIWKPADISFMRPDKDDEQVTTDLNSKSTWFQVLQEA